MITLYGYKGSGSAIVEAALDLAGADYRIVSAATWDPASALDELEKVNPLRQIPTLVLEDSSVLTESAAILMHLGAMHPHARLLPADPAQRAQVQRGLVYIAANCYSAIGIIDFPERWCAAPDDATNARIREGARARLHRHWEIFADMFAPQAALFNRTVPSALALMAVVVSKWSGTRDHLCATRPRFLDALEQVEKHPVVAAVLARHWDR
jgi:GST-like protein